MASLEEQLANLRAGRTPAPPARVLYSTPAVSLIPQHDEIDEDDWDDDEPKDPVSTAVLPVPPLISTPLPVQQTMNKPAETMERQHLNQRQLYERAIEITKSAMAKERARDFDAAVNEYVDAGDIFTEIGRNERDPQIQRTLKKKAFSLLQRAEALADWIDSHADTKVREATPASDAADKDVQAAEQHIQAMKQELQQLKYSSQIMQADDSTDLVEATQPPQDEYSMRESMKKALVNEIHGLLNLPEINSLRKFEPLDSTANKAQYAEELKAQVAQLQKELSYEKASHQLTTAVRKHKYSKMASADQAEQARLQAQVTELRRELEIHQAALEMSRQSIAEITEEKLRVEAQSARQVQSLEHQLNNLSTANDSRWKRTQASRMQWFQGPRGLRKQAAEEQQQQPQRRRSEPGSPRNGAASEEEESTSVWL
ncbi:hypothetical protein LEN26_010215 [Aphanomyces euteiches]|nr:hypothetical protein LEN26_010215 [Aphanomyces euteiches]KAH9127196.1 hypothetical protein AeMF1_002460 [Aphanomyces euteiches]KAH9191473.1 hypothetical protein AeNC1_006542 [Aphanomyces euteiches]